MVQNQNLVWIQTTVLSITLNKDGSMLEDPCWFMVSASTTIIRKIEVRAAKLSWDKGKVLDMILALETLIDFISKSTKITERWIKKG